jgi:hypothetical protein
LVPRWDDPKSATALAPRPAPTMVVAAPVVSSIRRLMPGAGPLLLSGCDCLTILLSYIGPSSRPVNANRRRRRPRRTVRTAAARRSAVVIDLVTVGGGQFCFGDCENDPSTCASGRLVAESDAYRCRWWR